MSLHGKADRSWNHALDLVITHGVFNPCYDKPKVMKESYRMWRPGGPLVMADLILELGISAEEAARKGSWSNRIAGTVGERSLLAMAEAAGFVQVIMHSGTAFRTSSCTQGALFSARKSLE